MLTLYNLSFFAIGIWLLYLKTIYMGVSDVFNYWLPCMLTSIVLTIIQFRKVENTHRIRYVLFPIGIAIILAVIISEIPTITYKEAQKIIEEETGESILTPPQNEKAGQLGMYFIYTEQGRYIVNAEEGTFSKSGWIRKE